MFKTTQNAAATQTATARKLTLAKTTLRALSASDLNGVLGAGPTADCSVAGTCTCTALC